MEHEIIDAVQYEYVRVKEPFNPHAFIRNAKEWLFGDPTRFIWNMVLYHILIAFSTLVLRIQVPANVPLQLGMGDVAAVNAEMQAVQSLQNSITNILFLAVILFLDAALLIIIKSEIKSLDLTYGKILLLEVPIFLLGLWSPYIRTGLFFFSANTLWITIGYRWFIKKWKPFQYFFIAGSSILIVKLVIFVIATII